MQSRNKDVDIENGLEDTGWEGEAGSRGRGNSVSWDEVREWHGHTYTTKCKIES